MATKVYGPEEIGEIKIGDTVLPLAFQSMVVTSNLRLKEVKSPGKSGSSKQPLGWEDATIELAAIAVDDLDPAGMSAADKIELVDKLFFAQDKKGKPLVYPIANVILAAKGIKKVIITTSKTDVPGGTTVNHVALTLQQHVPAPAKKAAKKRAAAAAVAEDPNGKTVMDAFGQGMTISVAAEQEYDANVAKYNTAMGFVGRSDAAQSFAPSREFG